MCQEKSGSSECFAGYKFSSQQQKCIGMSHCEIIRYETPDSTEPLAFSAGLCILQLTFLPGGLFFIYLSATKKVVQWYSVCCICEYICLVL